MIFPKYIAAGGLSLTMVLSSLSPAASATVRLNKPEITQNIELVRNDRRYPRRGSHHNWKRGHRHGHWNGHRGYRNYRHGYRRHNDGWWYPLAAFGAGAIIGGAISSPQPVYRVPAYNNSHIQWCYNRYRSYRASDNTFQPYNGPRQQCYSPY